MSENVIALTETEIVSLVRWLYTLASNIRGNLFNIAASVSYLF